MGRIVKGDIRLVEGKKAASRRDFLRMAAVGAAAATAFSFGMKGLFSGSSQALPRLSDGVVLPDPSLCIGCLTCEVICSRWHKERGLSALPRITILIDKSVKLHPEILANYPERGTFSQRPCRMCPEPECLAVCPANALLIDGRSGARYIEESRCVACGRCEEACPYEIKGVLRRTNAPILSKRIWHDPQKDVYVKCDLCRGRPEGPICVERCPVNIRIKQGVVKTDQLALANVRATKENWEKVL